MLDKTDKRITGRPELPGQTEEKTVRAVELRSVSGQRPQRNRKRDDVE